jgi:hypothetical protein
MFHRCLLASAVAVVTAIAVSNASPTVCANTVLINNLFQSSADLPFRIGEYQNSSLFADKQTGSDLPVLEGADCCAEEIQCPSSTGQPTLTRWRKNGTITPGGQR